MIEMNENNVFEGGPDDQFKKSFRYDELQIGGR